MSKIKKQFLSGIIYTGLAKYMGIIVSLAVTAILARLLSPPEFGIIAIATIFINFFSSITVTGIAPSIVQNKNISETDLANIFSFTFYLAIALSLIFVVLIPFISSFYEKSDQLQSIFYLLTPAIFFSVMTIAPNAQMLKNKEFKFISIRTIAVQLSVGLIAIVAALSGLGVYALVINPILSSFLIFIISISKYRIPLKFRFERSSVQKILKFSIYQMLFNTIFTIYRSIDKILVGKYFNMTQLGYYEKSYRLMMLPLENVSGVINPVLHPIFSDYQHNPKLILSSYIKIMKLLMEAGFLLTAYLFFSAREIVLIFFGNQWEPSVPVFRILALSVGIQLAQAPVGAVFQSINKINKLFFCSLIVLLLVCIAIGGGIYLNDIVYLSLFLVISFFLAFYIYHTVLFYSFKMSFRPILKMSLNSSLISLGLAILLLTVSILTSINNIFISLMVNSMVSILYVVTLLKFNLLKKWPLPHFVKRILKLKNYSE